MNEKASRTIVSYFSVRNKVLNRTQRFAALDLQRGLIMLLMAFQHCREYVGTDYYANYYLGLTAAWKGDKWIDFFQQFAVGILVAGGFYMMMGIGILFFWESRQQQGWSASKRAKYLMTRGLMMIFIQFTLLEYFECFSSHHFFIYVGVLFGLGGCMILAAFSLLAIDYLQKTSWSRWLNFNFVLPIALIISIMAISHGIVSVDLLTHHQLSLGDGLLLFGGDYQYHGIDVDLNYVPLPWFPAVALGLIIGKMLNSNHLSTMRRIVWIAMSFLLCWFLLRTIQLNGISSFGDYKIFDPKETLTWHAYFTMTKFPPSLNYLLWACGMNLLGIVFWDRLVKNVSADTFYLQPIEFFGQSALFFFIAHWFVYYFLSLLLPQKLESASGIFAFWVLGLIILYPLCYYFRAFQRTKTADSWWRMI